MWWGSIICVENSIILAAKAFMEKGGNDGIGGKKRSACFSMKAKCRQLKRMAYALTYWYENDDAAEARIGGVGAENWRYAQSIAYLKLPGGAQ